MIKARPHLNGNTAEDFRHAYRQLTQASEALQTALVAMQMNVTHGRNYQHMTADKAYEARLSDEDHYTSLRTAIKDIEQMQNGLLRALKET